ncbi:MAG: sigma 54-interacting transcriptional regulator [Desulfuromonas sp.]|nr:sigma 54-interacting transcriptional regulator [Desulfuromonas sp.]
MSADDPSLLPVVTPDLVLHGAVGGHWTIAAISRGVVEGLDGGQSYCGAAVDRVFADVRPSLCDLAEEVLSSQNSLQEIPIQFADGQRYRAEVVEGGLSDDYRSHTVMFYLHPLPHDQRRSVESFHDMIGASVAMQEVYRKIGLYAASDAAVVITGETGSGKELVARAIHAESARHDKPYIALNCSAIAEDLLESELFGHEKGAFTGAVRSHRGRFERADGGSLFLDEIGDMPLHTQTRLLRVLEERSVEPVGSERVLPIDVRIICATNVGLEDAVGKGLFRSDLYHRISVLRIHLPPLRERSEDIPLLVTAFLDRFSHTYQRRVEKLTPEAMTLLQSYLWPGNIRELRNVMERIFVENHAAVIGVRAFSEWVRERQNFITPRWEESPALSDPPLIPPYPLPVAAPRELSEERIRQAYTASNGNISAAARALGVHRATLYRHLKRLGLDRSRL